jgi:2,3,4,5-tetrahydropyridine-2-carboxylate N-succinyltransferase
MVPNSLKADIEYIWENKDFFCAHDSEKARAIIILQKILKDLTAGKISVVCSQTFSLNIWVKQAILLMFRFYDTYELNDQWRDKIPLLSVHSVNPSTRVVPGAWIREGVFLDEGVIVMPSCINIGAFIGARTMIDMGASIGSCAFIGKHCHISANTTIGGVLEPLQAKPVVIEDDCFIGANCHILEGVHVHKGCVLGSGITLSASTKIIQRMTQEISYGRVPPGSVVVPGAYTDPASKISLSCAVIIKTVDAQTKSKTALNDLLRPI